MKKMINTLVEWISVILTAIVIAFIITQFIRPTLVRGESMYPTLSEDDYLIINKISYKVKSPENGDIIVFKTNLLQSDGTYKDLVKRVIATEGDHLVIKDFKVYVNGNLVDEPYIQNHDAFLLRNHGALTVGCNLNKAMFVMEEVEFNAKICKYAMELGAVHEIPNNQLKKLMDLRKKMNLPGRHPGIEIEEEKPVCQSKEELVAEITRKVLAELKK